MNTSVQLRDPALDELDDGPSVSLVDLLTWVGESKRFIGGIALATGVVAAGISLLLPNVYTARTTMVPPNSQQQSGSAAALAIWPSAISVAACPGDVSPVPGEGFESCRMSGRWLGSRAPSALISSVIHSERSGRGVTKTD